MKQLLMFLSVVLFISTASCQETVVTEIKVVSSEEMQTLLDLEDVQLVDVRTPEEFNEGYIEGSQNIDFKSPTFDTDISKLDKSKPVILYCHSGRRSATCAKKLKDAGFKKIFDLEGGISQWKHEGYKVITIN